MRRLFALFVLIAIINLIAKSQTADKITVVDTRNVDSAPNEYDKEVKFEFKLRNTVGVPGSGNYSGNMTLAPWADNTGDKSHQLNFNEGGVFYRTGEPDNTSWDPWRQIIMTNINGDVGFGTSTPNQALDIIGDGIEGGTSESDNTNKGFRILTKHFNSGQLPMTTIMGYTYNGVNSVRVGGGTSSGNYATEILFYTATNTTTASTGDMVNHERMRINSNGNVGIGTTTPTNKLEVNGTIRSKEVKVEASPWPDYVFTEEHTLPDLQEVNTYIQQNGHLPEIPTAKEVEENGISLGEMNAKLLQKIEELTLYTIEQEGKIETLIKGLESQSELIKEQNKRIEKFENLK